MRGVFSQDGDPGRYTVSFSPAINWPISRLKRSIRASASGRRRESIAMIVELNRRSSIAWLFRASSALVRRPPWNARIAADGTWLSTDVFGLFRTASPLRRPTSPTLSRRRRTPSTSVGVNLNAFASQEVLRRNFKASRIAKWHQEAMSSKRSASRTSSLLSTLRSSRWRASKRPAGLRPCSLSTISTKRVATFAVMPRAAAIL